MKRIDWDRYAPPGSNWRVEVKAFIWCMIWSTGCSLIYIYRYLVARSRLWRRKELIPGAKIEPFFEILDDSLGGFLLLAFALLVLVGTHYAYYRQGSKSIYLMRRLPDGMALHRTCWTMPLLGMAISALGAGVLTVLYFALYLFATPAVCLPWT